MLFNPTKINLFPTLPGVYLMKDTQGTVLYVGKANNLRQRVRQYFVGGGDGRPMIPFLVSKVESIETIVVTSEKEALLLENTLIKQHKPKYNALLKDDKTYVALKVTTKQRWPMVQLIRYRGKPPSDGTYFGPYTGAYAARQTLDLLQRIFPLRQCSDQEFARRTRPCILYDMKRCCAPCVLKCTQEEYQNYVNGTLKFLKGQDQEVVQDLYSQMHTAAERLDFERAAELKKLIDQVEGTIEGQRVARPLGGDTDVLGLYRQADAVFLVKLLYRNGTLSGSETYPFSHNAQEDFEVLESFLIQEYKRYDALPHEILLPIELSNSELIGELLSEGKRRKVSISSPHRGEKRALIAMANTNAQAAFKKEKTAEVLLDKALLEMQERFHLSRYPKVIECFDNSNIGGDEPVSSLVCYVNGKKESSRYRKYKTAKADAFDDYGAMREVLQRRFARMGQENGAPDLLVVDGGKGHLNVALSVLKEMNIITVDVIGVAKEEGRHDRGMTSEQVFLPNIKDPILLGRTSPILFLLQQIRDEAHRFAITFQKKRRSKKLLTSVLDAIPGIGPIKKKKLLRHFGSFKRIKEASVEELKKVKGLSSGDIERIRNFDPKDPVS